MLLRRNDYPIHFDKIGTGNFVPDIILYKSPPLYDKRIPLNSFEDIKNYEDSMEQHIIAIEHFKIGNFSYLKNSKKVVNKLSEYESNLYFLDNKEIEKIHDLQNFKIKDKSDIFTSFKIIYQKHFSKLDKYKIKIREDNLLGHAVNPDGSINEGDMVFN